MADINFPAIDGPAAAAARDRAAQDRAAVWDVIELLFFAYRDFVSDPDDALAKFNFGRAHHRVLHFVNRNPGMKVAELLDVLKITKQSLRRVLKQLTTRACCSGRCQRSAAAAALCHPKGEALALKLAGLQSGRIARALSRWDRTLTRRPAGSGRHDRCRQSPTACCGIARAGRARRPRA